jgi:adenylate cyclase
MSTRPEHRKLAAIMFTDIVGYSALVERNEALALQLLEEHRRLLRSIFPKHQGSEIKTIGDGFLVEFSSALAAVESAIEIQEAITKRNSANPSQGNFQVRIGIHAGDVVRRADDVIGDGVNIAARIVPLAGGGGICISKQVFDQVENRLLNSPQKMGQVKLKNMIRPIEVYWVGYKGAAADPPELVQADKFSSPQKSIAVLPFLNMSSDPENEYLSDGLTEDLIMAFSRLKGLRVPARTSSFAFKGKNEDVRRIGEQLNVTNILEGSVRKAGERLRITAQLINVIDGDHLWAQTFDRQLQDVFAIQDEITRAIVRALEMQLIGAGDQPLAKHGTYNTDAYQFYLQGKYHFHKFTTEGFKRCIECCKKALAIEPNYALAYAALSLCYQTAWFYGHLSFEEKLAGIGAHDEAAGKAVELDPNLAETQTALAIVTCWNLRDWPKAEDCFKQAIKLNPNYVTAHEHYAIFLGCMRRTDEAMTHARLAKQLDPLSPIISLHAGFTYWLIHRYDLMLEQAHTLLRLESDFFGTHWLLAWAHWSQGMHEAAIAELRKVVALGGGPIPLADLGCLLGQSGRKAEGQQVLEELNDLREHRYVQPAYLGFVHASLGNYDEAFACFERGLEHENASIAWVREYCIFAGLDGLLADPRFPALLERIGLEETSRDQGTGLSISETVVKKELDNSVTDVSESPKKCSRCGAVTRIGQKTCINCLLHEGLEAKGEASRETFESVLAEADVTDKHWRLGHYEILEEIGRGGMGVIYRARQQHSRRVVAVKRILAHQVNSHETLLRFRREAEAVASLDHPNILPIYEVSESEEGLPFFSMKYATGGSLRTAAPTLRKDPRECVRVMGKVARSIAYAHGKGILHRDLQPGNILLDENGEPMVSDFGLAKWLDQGSDLTRTLETLGTPGYIAPEQIDCPADKLTCAADVYSLGAILFYLLTGRPPIVGTNVLHVIHQAAASPAPRLRSLVPSLDRDLETIVARCLESDPKARYQSAGALAEDLEHWLQHEPIRARHVGILTRGRKWVRRNPTSAALVASLIALVAAVSVMFLDRGSVHTLPPSNAMIPDKSIAVLPFENLSADPENAFFADGVQDEILNDLAKIADLKVISRTSVMQYKSGAKRNVRQIANELGVAHVVEGSVQRAANRVRVSAQLIDAKTDAHLWAESYDRSLDDVFAIQSDIAKAIAGQLHAKLSPSQATALTAAPTHDPEAYDLFLKGEYQERQAESAENRELFDRAETFYRQALARDPNFALAYARLAYSRMQQHWFSNRLNSAQLEEVKSNIERALAIAPDLPEAHLALGVYHYWGHLDYDSALKALDRAIELQPSNSDSRTFRAVVYRRRGEWRRSLVESERVLELNPRESFSSTDIGDTYLSLRRWSEAERALSRGLALDPHNINAAFHLAQTYINSTGDIRRARHAWEGIPEGKGQVSPYGIVISQMIRETAYLDVLERRFADALKAWDVLPTDTAEERLNKLKARVGIQVIAGQKEAAKSEAERARVLLEAQLAERAPEDHTSLTELAWVYACLGRNVDALRLAREAAESMPIEKDAILGVNFLVGLAQIEAHTGQSEEAVKHLRQLLTMPAGEYISVARLKIDPVWDPIRNNPGFQKLLSEPEPETVYN